MRPNKPWRRYSKAITHQSVTRGAFWLIPSFVLFVLPLIFWTGLRGDLMNLGGDDSHLMYPYPIQWLAHASIPLLDHNLAGYNPRIYFLPFTMVLVGIKLTSLNVEGIVFGATLALTYVGVTRVTLELLGDYSWRARAAGAFAGAIAVFAPLVAETQWTYMLTAIFWQPLLPWVFLLYLWHQKSGAWSLLPAAAAVVAIGAPAINDFPWTISCGLLLLGLSIVAAIGGIYRFNPIRVVTFGAAIIALNAFWILPIVVAPVFHQAQFAAALSNAGKVDAVTIVHTIGPMMNAGDVLSLRTSQPFLKNFDLPQLVPDQWSRSLGLLGLIPVILMGLGFVATSLRQWTIRTRLVFGLTCLTVLFFYLETLVIFPGGVGFFEFLTRHVPGWTAERNFYDKFATPFAEIFAITCGVCLYQLSRGISDLVVLGASACLVASLAVYDAPFLVGSEFRLPYYGDVSYTRVMHGLPPSYLSVLAELRNLPPGPILTVPLAEPAWSVVPADQGGVYIGISPVFFLTGRSDYNGVQAFDSPSVPFLSAMIRRDLQQGQATSLARVAGELGVRYVLVAHEDDVAHSFYKTAAVPDPILEQAETAKVMTDLAPTVVARFGSYELRELNPAYQHSVFTLQSQSRATANSAYLVGVNQGTQATAAPDPCASEGPVDIRQASQDEYVVMVPPTSERCLLIFREAFSPNWQAVMTATDKSSRPVDLLNNEAYGFANAYAVPPATGWREIHLRYGPQTLLTAGAGLSLLSLLALLMWK